MKICKEYLGGKPHSYFMRLSREDKRKLFLFEEWERRREKWLNDKLDLEMKSKERKK